MRPSENPRSAYDPNGDINLRVFPVVHGGFGVYADAVLIAIHEERVGADAHCQRLRLQQADER
jgi:hypothetical protein